MLDVIAPEVSHVYDRFGRMHMVNVDADGRRHVQLPEVVFRDLITDRHGGAWRQLNENLIRQIFSPR